MPAPKNTVLAENIDYEGYCFKDIKDDEDLALNMGRLASGDLELMQYVKPSRKTLGAKAYRAYAKSKRLLATARAKRKSRHAKEKQSFVGEPAALTTVLEGP
jgi:hypothetical protein